jgi:hypothetical protein
MKDTLVQAGLTTAQADTYLLLLDQGFLAPPAVAAQLSLTRSNAYKVLEQLMEMGLSIREERQKKCVYGPGDPCALNDLLARERNRVLALEEAVNASLQALRAKYQQQTSTVEVKAYHGAAKLKRQYEHQAEQKQPIYFIKSRADLPVMGYEFMDAVRRLATTHGNQRYGITTDSLEAPANPEIDARTNLTRTWIDEDDYTAPVEWSVSGDEVTLFVFEKDGSAIRITSPAVADSLRQIFALLDKSLRTAPGYDALPRKAGRQA